MTNTRVATPQRTGMAPRSLRAMYGSMSMGRRLRLRSTMVHGHVAHSGACYSVTLRGMCRRARGTSPAGHTEALEQTY